MSGWTRVTREAQQVSRMVRLAKDSRAQARKVKGQDFLIGAYLGNARGLMQAARIIKGYDSMAILFWERSKEVA